MIPEPRGPVSAGLLSLLSGQPAAEPAALALLHQLVDEQVRADGDIIADEDLQLAMFCLHELHYGGLDGVDDRWEWDPDLIRVHQLLEAPFEKALRTATELSGSYATLPPAEALSSDDRSSLRATVPARL